MIAALQSKLTWHDSTYKQENVDHDDKKTYKPIVILLLVLIAGTPAMAGITNGDFSNGLTGWVTAGPVTVEGSVGNEVAVLDEDELGFDATSLQQVFQISPGTSPRLTFNFAMFIEGELPKIFPRDAFLVSLLDPATLMPLGSSVGFSDLFAVEFDGKTKAFSVDAAQSFVSVANVSNLTTSQAFGIGGEVTMDLSSLPVGTPILLDYRLAGGFDGFHSQVLIDHAAIEEFIHLDIKPGLCPNPVEIEQSDTYCQARDSCNTNLLSDASFENGGTGWAKLTNGGRSLTTAESHTGSTSVQMVLSSRHPREVFQSLPVTEGMCYSGAVWMKLHNVGGEGALLLMTWRDTGGNVLGTSVLGGLVGDHGWTRVTGGAIAPAGAASVRFLLHAGVDADGVGTVWFDDAEMCTSSSRGAPLLATGGDDGNSGGRSSTPSLSGAQSSGSRPLVLTIPNSGTVPMAVVGTAQFDVTTIDPNSIVLSRTDGVGGTLRPVETTIKDVAAPFTGVLCDCHTLTGDGVVDLLADFLRREMIDVLDLRSVTPNTEIELTITGTLNDGTVFRASDCILVVFGGSGKSSFLRKGR